MSDELRDLPLRERKKARTRRALAETALRLFTERGYDATTLDDLCDAVEVSRRTFFRNYRSKEDVALAADSDLWSAYLDDVAARELTGPLIEALRAVLDITLGAMDPDWERRFLAARELSDAVPALQAHSLGYCHDTTRALVEVVSGRPGADVDPWRLRLSVEIFVAAWRTASLRWTAQGGHGGRDTLMKLVEETFADLPAALTSPA
ncbi:TetR family transcriptional regulator [Nonomuraea roseoviolacea subsp. roseoviolacea]|uniref:AcrR family transcriptional regulator n=1 Tax=Nonomuraea roseoviolacea subsp. carminata TaxID=160689 RepID=A0ABT1KFB4_9ACTN|nr:TetR family transcriptional regulator [Nonomuraea roseoviolacea]MCP2352715.1 AcrR family transcriptional regulator [Nonomuraea roseoviolacea subsp. carminata]